MEDKVKKIIYTSIFLLISFSVVYSDDNGVMVRPMSQGIFETVPDANVMTVFSVMNQTSEKLEFISETVLPNGWKMIAPDMPFEIEPHSNEMRLIGFRVPKETPAGRYEVSFTAVSRKYLSVSNTFPIFVNVLPVKRLSISLLDVPAYAVAGESYSIPFTVVNESNVGGTVILDFNSVPSYILQPDTTQMVLASGESCLCSVRVTTDKLVQSVLNHFVSISARFEGDSAFTDQGKSVVKIVPRSQVKADRYNRFPINVGISYAMQQDGYSGRGWQFEASGSGSVSTDPKGIFSFYFRGPDTYLENLYTYGVHEQYSAGYRNEKVQVDLGDKSYTLSKLTEQFRWGRGAEAQVRVKNWNMGAFAHKTLYFWSGSVKHEAASYIRHTLKGRNSVGLNYLNKKTSDIDADILSAQGHFRWNKYMEMDLEYAGSSANGEYQQAANAALSGRLKNLSYAGYGIYASPGYPGYYTNTRIHSLGLNYRFRKNLRVDFNLNQQQQQYDEETHQVIAPVLKYNSFGLIYEWREKTRFNFARTSQSSHDRFDQPLFDYCETAYRFNLDQSFRNLTLAGGLETGRTQNRMLERDGGLFRLNFSAHISPNVRNSLSGYLTYDNDKRYSDQRYKRWTFGFDASGEILRNTAVNLSYQSQYSPESYFEDRNLFEFGLNHRLGATQEFAIRCRKILLHNSLTKEEIAVKADYRLRLGVPIGMNRSVGSVKGTLLDLENRKPVQKAVIRLNEYMAVTDDDGRFHFQSIPPGGDYFLSLDKSTIGLDKVLAQPTPLRVSVAGGGEKILELGIVRGCGVKGRVVVYAVVNDSSDHFSADKMKQYLDEYYVAGSSQNKDKGVDVTVTNGKTKLVPGHGLGSVLVELKKDNEVHRRVTDNDGSFVFDGLRPGQWFFTVYEYNLPEMHRLEQPAPVIDLNPGDDKQVQVRVLPIRRQIQFVKQENLVLLEQKK